jgi:hypothetical protein
MAVRVRLRAAGTSDRLIVVILNASLIDLRARRRQSLVVNRSWWCRSATEWLDLKSWWRLNREGSRRLCKEMMAR